MIGIDKIVNLFKHPIVESNNYINRCHDKLKKESVLQLDNFLTDEAISLLQNEAKILHGQAYYCCQFHTILLKKKDE